jgi:hypothetical protein
MPRILAASGGFLLAVLWMDLMFDVQVLASELGGAPMPESALASSAGYYRHVVTESGLMRQFISFVIVVTVGGSLVQATRGGGVRWRRVLAPLLCGSASTLAVRQPSFSRGFSDSRARSLRERMALFTHSDSPR